MEIKMNMQFSSADENGKMNYAVYYPDDYTDLPLMIYLHGAGERGTNFEHIYRCGLPMHLAKGRTYPAVILVPQCPAKYVWDNVVEDVKSIIDETVVKFDIKPDRICLTGSSMGGFGTWMMGLTYRNFFSAIAPIAGGGMSWRASNLCTTPVYAVHGTEDKLVLPVCSQMMCDAVNATGGNAKLVLMENAGHGEPINEAYGSMDVVDWLLSQRRTDFREVPEMYSFIF